MMESDSFHMFGVSGGLTLLKIHFADCNPSPNAFQNYYLPEYLHELKI